MVESGPLSGMTVAVLMRSGIGYISLVALAEMKCRRDVLMAKSSSDTVFETKLKIFSISPDFFKGS